MNELTHLDSAGQARMVDVTDKPITARRAVARARIRLSAPAFAAVLNGEHPKGDVLAVARIAGIQGAKKTADLIPLCHPLPLTGTSVEINALTAELTLEVIACCKTDGKTGVEMEALTAASVAALTLYDMCKALDKGILIEELCLLEKDGGKSGPWRRQ